MCGEYDKICGEWGGKRAGLTVTVLLQCPVCHLNLLLGCLGKTVEPGLFSKPIEFDGIKIWVVDLLPDAEEFEGVAVP